MNALKYKNRQPMAACQFVEKVVFGITNQKFFGPAIFKNAGEIQRQSLWSLTAVSENPLSKAHLQGVN